MAQKPPITQVPSPNFGYPAGAHGRQGRKVLAIVHHIMQGTLSGTDSWFANPASDASAHFGIGRDGTIHQYVALEDAAWANGKMQKPDTTIPWLRDCWDKGVNPNLVTVSIEYEGAHTKRGDTLIPDWAPTEAQYQAGLALTRWLCEQLGIKPDPHTIIGHFQIDSVDRPYCPGPLFPFSRMLKALAPASSGIQPIPVVLLGGRTVQGELRGQTTWFLVGDTWLPVRQVAAAVGATVEYIDAAHGGPRVELKAPK